MPHQMSFTHSTSSRGPWASLGGGRGQASRFDALDEVVFAVPEQVDDAVDVALVQPELFGNRCWLKVLRVEALYFAQQVRR